MYFRKYLPPAKMFLLIKNCEMANLLLTSRCSPTHLYANNNDEYNVVISFSRNPRCIHLLYL